MNKKRIIRNLLVAIPAAVVAILVLCIVVINTDRFRNFLRSELSEQVKAGTGARLEIGSIRTNWTHLDIVLEKIIVHGNENAAVRESPLLTADSLEVRAYFLPLLHRKLELRELILERPIVHVRIDAHGNSNLPIAPAQTASGNASAAVFDWKVKDCALRAGELYYNDLRTPLDAELHNLQFTAGYGALSGKYTGALSYDEGRISTPQIKPLVHDMQLQFAADRSGLSINPLVLRIAKSQLTLQARINDYANPTIDGTYDGAVSTRDVAGILRARQLPLGDVTLDGTFGYRAASESSFLTGLRIDGHMRSAQLNVPTAQRPLEFSSVAAAYELANANMKVDVTSANVLGGRARASWQMRRIDSTNAESQVGATLRGVSLTRASDSLAPRNVRRIPLVGTANLDFRGSWAKSLDNLVAHIRLTVSGPDHVSSPGSIPVTGLVQADYDAPRNVIAFSQSYLQTTNTRITIGGTLSSRRAGNSNIEVLASTSDLGEVATIATLVQNAMTSGPPPIQIPALAGSSTVHAKITGTAKQPHIESQISAQNLSVDGTHWKSLSLNLTAQPSQVSLQNAVLVGNPRGRIAFSAKAGLAQWSLPANSSISASATVADISLADAERVAELHYPVSGTIAGSFSVKGTRQKPEAKGTITLTHASAWNEPIDNLTINANSNDGTIHSTVALKAPAGGVSGQATYKLETREYAFNLNATGIALDKIETLQRSAPLAGTLNVSAAGSGTLQNPQLQAKLAAPQLQFHGQTVSDLVAQIDVANQHAKLAVHSKVYQASIEAKADVNLNGSRYADASVDVLALPVAPVLAAFLPGQTSKIEGQTEIHLTAKGPVADPARMEAHLEVPTLALAYGKAQLSLAKPLHADYQNGALTLLPTQVRGTGTNLTFGGVIPLRGSSAYSLTADGSVDLNVFQQFAPGVRSSGEVLIHVRSQGGLSDGGIRGQVQVKNAVLSTDSIPVALEGLDAQIDLSGNRADITKFSGSAGGGNVSASGFVTYGRNTNFNLAVNANSVRIRYPEGLRSVLSGRIVAEGTPAASTLTGRVLVDRLSFTQTFDLSSFAGYFSEDSAGAAPSSFERNMRINLAVQSAQDLNLASSKLSMGGTANLNVIGSLADPVVLGRITLTNGEVFFLSKRFEVQTGTIEFANASRTQPVVNMRVTTTVEQYNLTLALSGRADRLRINYTSEPALPPADIIHLLAFGTTNAEAASAPSSSVATSAESVLAQGVSSQVSGKVESLTGISQLTIDPLATNSQGNPGAQVAIQQRVTGSLLLTFSTDVTSTQSQTVELQYQFNKRLSVTALRDQNGGYGLNLRLHKEF